MNTVLQSYGSETKLRLPNKNEKIISIVNKIPIRNMYEIKPSMGCFDPNISSSPPNHFVKSLNQRIQSYYSA